MREQLQQMQKMGGLSGLMGMMPGVAKIKSQIAERNIDDSVVKRQMAIIDSMTPKERKSPDILKASRKKRIAAGAGTKVEEVNKLLKMHRGMADIMKMMGGGKAKGPLAGLGRMLGTGCRRRKRWRSSPSRCRAASPECLARRLDCRRRCPACRRNSRACPGSDRNCRDLAACRRTSRDLERRNDFNLHRHSGFAASRPPE
jgi:predicted Zn-ribbon and HTH transcriptional regulator